MEPNWSTGGTSSEAGGTSSSTHNPSSAAPYTILAVSHRQHMPLTHHTFMLLQYPDLLPITVRQAMQLTIVVLHHIHMLHMSVIVVQVGILFPSVTPRSRWYGDVTATYIRKSEVPSRIYAKHQYRRESEYESSGALYIPTHEYNYRVITRGDPILQ